MRPTVSESSPLQETVRTAIAASGKTRDSLDRQLQQVLSTSGKPLWDIERGKSKRPSPQVLRAIEEVLGLAEDRLVDLVHPRSSTRSAPPANAVSSDEGLGDIPMVGIRHADAAFGLGATFADEEPDIQVLQFPKVWVESITYSPAELLSWVRARGRSMEPTINDGDLILLDHSERKVRDQDEIWAFTVGDTRAIKRLRVKGDRFIILSDNPSVPPDEEPIDFVNIVARVVFVGKRT